MVTNNNTDRIERHTIRAEAEKETLPQVLHNMQVTKLHNKELKKKKRKLPGLTG